MTKRIFRRSRRGLKYSDRPEWKWKLVGDDGVHIEFHELQLAYLRRYLGTPGACPCPVLHDCVIVSLQGFFKDQAQSL